jgi:dTDP-4-amino-4,6-dideoxygalactose transaminase
LISPEEFGADSEAVRLALEKENIESRPVWKPMHLQPVFQVQKKNEKRKEERGKRRYGVRVVGGEVAEDLYNRGLCLPSGTAMNEEDLDRVINVIIGCRK